VNTRRALAACGGAAAAAFGFASVSAGQAHPGWWFAGESAGTAATELIAGLALIGAGAAVWWRRPGLFGPLLVLAGAAWFVPEWNNPDVDSSLTFTVGLALLAAAPPLVAHAALAYPSARLSSLPERAVLASAYFCCVGLIGVIAALVSDPAGQGCSQCPENLMMLNADAPLAEDLQRLGLQLGAICAVLLAGLAARRIARASAAERRLTAPVLAPAALYLLAVAVEFAHSADRGFLTNDSFDLVLWSVQAAVLVALAMGVAWAWVDNRLTRSALASLVVELERDPAPGGLREALSRRLGDPSLELLHPLRDGDLVDAAGVRRTPTEGRSLTPLVSGGRTLAVIAHRPGLFDAPGLAEQVVSAGRLALEQQRLQAELHAQLADLQASRARIVAAGDAERRRLERDLHDGAQQRLVALSLAIRLADHDGGALGRAQEEVGRLLADLRSLAHGIYPVALAEEGLGSAIEALAEDGTVDVRLDGGLPGDRLDPSVETAAYVLIREMTRSRRAQWATLRVRSDAGVLRVEVAGDGLDPGALVYLEDRVGAVGGRLWHEERGAGVSSLRAELPCG
jgi:signal transduction histidine kinase